jgi:hypothetical protein
MFPQDLVQKNFGDMGNDATTIDFSTAAAEKFGSSGL